MITLTITEKDIRTFSYNRTLECPITQALRRAGLPHLLHTYGGIITSTGNKTFNARLVLTDSYSRTGTEDPRYSPGLTALVEKVIGMSKGAGLVIREDWPEVRALEPATFTVELPLENL